MPEELSPPHIKLQLFNTLTRKKEALAPLKGKHVKMYTCGPTVYHFAHIGNFRTYIFEDLLRRTIQFLGMKVTQVMNITDVDDKTIKGAINKKVTLDAFTKPYKEAFFDDLKTLNIERAEHYPAATEFIPDMISLIEKLMDKRIAYKGNDGSVYYAIRKFPHYGCLSHFNLEELQTGASERVAADEYDKDNAADFVLWKAYDASRDGDIFWESPYGRGRPGWHLECSAMAMKILGKTLDIHAGGVDNMFPHHENEIAQSEACSGEQFVRLWMHAEHLVVDNKKMSKSLGNFYTLRDLLDKGYTGAQVRYMLLHTHYKTQLNFTFQAIEGIKVSLQRIQDFIYRMQEITQEESSGLVKPEIERAYIEFTEALADDLNISLALAAVFELIREVNVLCDACKVGRSEAEEVLDLLRQFNKVLGFLTFEKNETVAVELEEALAKRNEARQQKNWALADELRRFIISRGYVIEDTPKGARLKRG